MVTAELIHNPYLLQTSVKFNGNSPRINSQVEKYESMPLKKWVDKIPAIFYDEMNGYDFDLNYTGTVADFNEVVKAFNDCGVTPEEVRLFHKNELEDVNTKVTELEELLHWLCSTPNRKFNYSEFQLENSELFSNNYPYIVINGNIPQTFSPYISVESVGSSAELKNTFLKNTPILFFINEQNLPQFRENLVCILNRSDILQNQLFFIIHPYLNTYHIKRIIEDLGVCKPQIISKYDDPSVIKYFQDYPVTEFIREAINVFEKNANSISEILKAENEESLHTNASVHEKIEACEAAIERLKASDVYFTERDNLKIRDNFEPALENFEVQINKWRNRKTKIVGRTVAQEAAEEYNSDLRLYFENFISNIEIVYNQTVEEISKSFVKQFSAQDIDRSYTPDNSPAAFFKTSVKSIVSDLMALEVVSYEEPKQDLMGLLFKTSQKAVIETEEVITYYYEDWRNKAFELLIPIAEHTISKNVENLSKFYTESANAYHKHLTALIENQECCKNQYAAELSDDERKLQADNDWLRQFRDKLEHIEKG